MLYVFCTAVWRSLVPLEWVVFSEVCDDSLADNNLSSLFFIINAVISTIYDQ